MENQNKIEAELYHDLNQCLQLFNQKNRCMAKIIKYEFIQAIHEVEKLQSSAQLYINKYQANQSPIHSQQLIIKRFISRIKQNCKNFIISHSQNDKLSQYIHKLLATIPDDAKSINLPQLLKNLLLKREGDNKDEERTIDSVGNDSNRSSSYLFFKAIEREQKLMNGLEIETNQFRRVFFLAKQQEKRKNNILTDHMLKRNSLISDNLKRYQRQFQQFKAKNNRESKSRTEIGFLDREIEAHKILQKDEEKKNKTNVKFHRSKKFLTLNGERSEKSSPIKSLSTLNYFKTSKASSTKRQRADDIKSRTVIEDFILKMRKDNVYKMNKVNFFVSDPSLAKTKKNKVEQIRKKKIVFRKNDETKLKNYVSLAKTISDNPERPKYNFEFLKIISPKRT